MCNFIKSQIVVQTLHYHNQICSIHKKKKCFRNDITQSFFSRVLRIFFFVTLITTWGCFSSESWVWANNTISIIDTLGEATPTTQFSVSGSASNSISPAGPEFTLSQSTVITEIGGFFTSCGNIINGVFQCPTTLPLTVQIHPSRNGLPDASTVLASFNLTYDNDPFVYSFRSVASNLTLPAGTYFALFNGNNQGAVLAQTTNPFEYIAGVVPWAYIDPPTGNFIVSPGEHAAVRILGTLPDVPISKGVLKINSLMIDQQRRNLFLTSIFALGKYSDGINPINEALTLKVGNVKKMIPIGSFQKIRHGVFTYVGQIDNVWIKAVIKPLGSNRFRLHVAEYDVHLSHIKNPVIVELTIGNDIGRGFVKAFIKKSYNYR